MKSEIRNNLIEKLEEAVEITGNCNDNYSDHFSNIDDFYQAMKNALDKIKSGDNSVLNSLTAWFVPSYDWDDFVGDVELGNKIFKLLIKFNKELEGKNSSKTKKEPTKADALKAIEAFLRLKEFDAADKLAKTFDISDEEIIKPFANLIEHSFETRSKKQKEALLILFTTEVLTIKNKRLTALPQEIGKLTNLKKLNLSINKLETLPREIAGLVNLEYLNLSDNEISTLPKEFSLLYKLRELRLGRNKLSIFPECILSLKNLEILTLNINKFKVLPDEFGKLSNLIELQMVSNKLSVLPKSFTKLKKLEKLYLSDNQIPRFLKPLKLLYKLKELYLDDNPLESIPDESLEKLDLLSKLFVENEKLTTKQNAKYITINIDKDEF